jgi:hypothetical protein
MDIGSGISRRFVKSIAALHLLLCVDILYICVAQIEMIASDK